jgi:molybdenum cofactor cytidylyltransferase
MAMVSAILTAAGKNRRMMEDMKTRKLDMQHKLLLDLHGKPVILQTLENVNKTGIEECIIVLGHFSNEISAVLSDYLQKKVKIVENPDVNVELSDTILNGISHAKSGLCLCVAADQPTVSSETLKKLIKIALEFPDPENIVSILAREDIGYLDSTRGLGMPFVCHSQLLKKYLLGRRDNLNPILKDMLKDGVVFYGIPPKNESELININLWNDYIQVLKGINYSKRN